VSIGGVRDDNSILLRSKLSRIVVLPELYYLLFFHFHVLLALADSHFHTTVLDYVVWAHVFLFFFSLSFISCFPLLRCHFSLLLGLIQTLLEGV